MKILLLCDDYWHPGNIPTDGIKPLEGKGYEFDIITDAADFSPEMLTSYAVVMICKSNQKSQADKAAWITKKIEKAFAEYVKSGGGLLVIHSGTVIDKETKIYGKLVGCRFTFHPNNCPVTVAPIMPHPITDGIGTFCELDEHYRLEIHDTKAKVLMASYSAAQGDESKYEEDPYHNTTEWLGAACLVKKQGKGRVCVLTPGHTAEVWSNAEFQRVLENALKWCNGK